MSKSFRKLLIVGGDSWSDPDDPGYREFNVKKIWPEMVADFLDYDIINISKGGAGNSYIHGQIIDAIEANSNRSIVVMVNWSQAIRLSLFELQLAQLTFNVHMPKLTGKFARKKIEIQNHIRELIHWHVYHPEKFHLSEEELWLKTANISLRDIYLLDQYCKTRNIPILHHRALHPLIGIEWILKPRVDFELRDRVLEVCKQNQYYQKILKFKNIVGHPNFFEKGSSCFDLYHKYFLSPDELHPNESGHQLIAHSFINKYIELYEEISLAEPSYVYD
mgnify:CR=1 FL=1